MLERRWVPLETVGVYVPRNLVSTLVMCAVPAQAAGVERIVVCTPPAGAGLVAAAAEALGIDEVWALGGPQAIGWLAYVRRVDKIVGPGNAYVNDAKLEVSRDVPIDLPGGPSEVVVVADADADPRIVELELAAQREHGHEAVCRVVATLEEAEAIAPEHLVLLGESEARAGRGAERRRRLRRRRRRRSPAGDYATGGNHVLPTNGWARSVGGLGLETFLKPMTIQRLTPEGLALAPADGRGARRRRGHARARGGGAAMKPLAPEFTRVHVGAADRRGRARSPGSTRRRSCATTRTRRRCRCPRRGPGTIAGALAGINGYPPGGYVELRRAIADYTGVDPEQIVLGVGADDLILLCARVFAGPGRHDRDPGRADLSALPHRGAARGRRGRRRRRRCSRSRAGRTARPASCGRCRTRGRSSSTRRTSSTAARRRSRCSTTAT